jgi:ankyrin repeat protein
MFFGLFGKEKSRIAEIIEAARSGDTEKIKLALSQGAYINVQELESGDTPLLAAIDNSQWAAAELLLEYRPDLSLQDKSGHTALYVAVSKGDSAIAMVNRLLVAGANAELGPSRGDNAGATPLHIACALGANDCLESLLRHGASVTKQLFSGAQPMHTAAIGGNHKTIELLRKAGGNLNAANDEDRYPLHNCGITGNDKVAAALVRLGAQVDPKDKSGYTPLMLAVVKGHTKVAKIFLDNGADPNILIRADCTVLYPLFMASMYGFDKMVKLLIEKGGKLKLIDGEPSLVNVAKHSGHASTAKILQTAMNESITKSIDEPQEKLPISQLNIETRGGNGIRFQVTPEGRLVITS